MAQRGEIQCADNQFALQSGRANFWLVQEDIKGEEMRQVANASYSNGYVDVFDARGVLLSHMRCDGLVGFGPEGFVVKRGNCYWVHNANGANAMAPMTPYNFNMKKWDMHDSYLRVLL